VSGVHSTRAFLTRYVPPAGFRTLLTDYSSRHRPALFHAGGTRRVSPFGAFPFRRSRGPHRTRSTRLPSAAARLPGLTPSGSPLPSASGLTDAMARCSLGFHPLQGFPPSDDRPRLPGIFLSRASTTRRPQPSGSLPLRVSLAGRSACLFRELPPLLGSCPFQRSRCRESTHPGLPHPVRSASRVSHPPDGLLLPAPPGLVSCRWHS
jgi:hypothetical protein